MRKFDIIFFDIDGTLVLHDHFTVTDRTRQALRAARAQGVKLSIATGRCLHILPQQVVDIGFDYAVTSNGAAVNDLSDGRLLYSNGLHADEATVAYRIIHPEVDFVEFFAHGDILLDRAGYAQVGTRDLPVWHKLYFSSGDTPVVESAEEYLAAGAPDLEKITLVRCDPEKVARIHPLLKMTGLYSLTSSIKRGLEVVRADCNKGAAITALCAQLNIPLSRAAAFGDGNNDLDMLRTVGCGVAMGNAKDATKEAAACVTATLEEDGVAQYLEKYVL